jgi:hypothetical protein
MNKYEALEIEVVEFEAMDVIVTSSCQYDMHPDDN